MHAAHGYLCSAFLNPKANKRTDNYGGSLENRMRLLQEIVQGIRQACGPQFAISVKLNSSDFQKGGSTEDDNLIVLAMLEKEGVDLVEVSGGNYESPAMVGATESQVRESTKKREAYFLEFAEKARKSLKIPLMVTGGFRTRSSMNEAIAEGHTDLIGLARPLALEPELPHKLVTSTDPNVAALIPPINWRVIPKDQGAFESFWHTMQMQRMADGLDPDPTIKPTAAFGFVVRNVLYEPQVGFATRWI